MSEGGVVPHIMPELLPTKTKVRHLLPLLIDVETDSVCIVQEEGQGVARSLDVSPWLSVVESSSTLGSVALVIFSVVLLTRGLLHKHLPPDRFYYSMYTHAYDNV